MAVSPPYVNGASLTSLLSYVSSVPPLIIQKGLVFTNMMSLPSSVTSVPSITIFDGLPSAILKKLVWSRNPTTLPSFTFATRNEFRMGWDCLNSSFPIPV